MLGPGTSVAEVTNVSRHGFWLLLDAEELLVPFASVQWPTADHLYWPQLDVDLSVASIRKPDDFPLLARVTT